MNLSEIKLEALENTLRIGKISDQEYFSPKYSAYVSNSRLGNINPDQGGSPEKFFNPIGKIYSEALILGSAVHQQVLQNEFFEIVSIDRPSSKLGFVCDFIFEHSNENHEITEELIRKASEEVGYYKGSLTEKRINDVKEAYAKYKESRESYIEKDGIEPMFLTPKMYETASKCIEACNNQEFSELLYPSYLLEKPVSENEQAFLLDIKCSFPDKEDIIVRLKSKLDNFTIDFESNTITVNDLKTIGSVLSKFDQGDDCNMIKFHYYRELAIYIWLLRMYAEQKYGMKNPHMKCNCLVVSTIPDYYTKIYKVTNKEIARGFKEFRFLLKLVAYYIAYEGYGLN